MAEIPFPHVEARAPQIRQLLSAREAAQALGQVDLVEAAEKHLRELGHDVTAPAPKVARDEAPVERRAQHERVQKADEGDEAERPASRKRRTA